MPHHMLDRSGTQNSEINQSEANPLAQGPALTLAQSVSVPSAAAADSAAVKIVRNYVFHLMPKVKGYLGAVDALAMASVLIGQRNASLGGGIAEIGVFFGRSFYLMAMLLDGNEKALAIDMFDIGVSPGRDSAQLKYFLEIGDRMGIKRQREMTLVGDALDVSPKDILAKTGPVRFFSIDGGHELNYVLHDANLAADAIADHGVICFDDFCNPEWPEVSLAIFDFLRTKAGDFAPFLISQKKLFVCRRQYRDFYRQLIEEASALRKVKKTNTRLLDGKTIAARSGYLEYLRCEAFARTGLSRLNALVY